MPIAPPPLKQKATPPPAKKPAPSGPKKIADIPAELLNRGGDAPLKIEDIHKALQQQTPGNKPNVVSDDFEDEEEGGGKGGANRRKNSPWH